MELNEFKAKLKSKDIAGAYLFVGEEEYLKRYYADELRAACDIDPAFDAFNRAGFDGAVAERAAVLEAISSPPMMSDFKLVEWRYAKLGTGKGEITREALAELAEAARETGYTVFSVTISDADFDLGTDKKPSRALAALAKDFSILRFDKSTDAQLMAWIKRHFDREGIEINRTAAEEMITRVGHSMDNLKGEIDKLTALLLARGKTRLEVADVREVCSANIEANAFALQKALSERSKKLAFAALYDLKSRRIDATAIVNSLAGFFSEILSVSSLLEDGLDRAAIEAELKIHPYRLKMCIASATKWGIDGIMRAAERISEIDRRTKSESASAYTLIEMFVAEYV